MTWLLQEGEVQGDFRWDEASHDGVDYLFEEQKKQSARELRVKMGREVVAATTYVDDGVPEGWDEDCSDEWKPGYRANDIDWFSMDPEFEDCDDVLDIYHEMKSL